ncbi:MAG TPA: DUF6600 domain-containing protein [Rhizomicrobium sp.]|jgi:hypothetical protein|nr:DUF6600 domain-containing protein [Rhizomicrobium sp.]
MHGRTLVSIAAIVALAGTLGGCDKMKGMVGGGTDFRNAQIDVSGTPCSAGDKFSTLMLKDGKFELAQYQFEIFGDSKSGDVSAHTTTTDADDTVFVGNCANNGQTSQVLFVYGPDGKRLGAADLTGNGKGLVQSYDVKDSTILVEQNQGNPPQLSKTNYALLNGKLVDTATGEPVAVAAADETDSGDVDTISFQSFHDKLQPYGKWIDHPRWGWSWHPLAANFRPYENGHWEDSDEYGSVWVSADPWGGTPYHYGRWGYDPNYGGWLWVPGYVWGPSWVVWRADDDNLGWFPIPPGEWDGDGEYPDYWSSWYGYQGVLDAAAFYALWSFVPAADIFVGNVRGRIIDRRGYGRFIGRTRGWGRIGSAHGHVVNRAFDRGRFAANFHRGFPGGARHDFHDRGLHTIAAGHRIGARELRSGGGLHVGVHERFGSQKAAGGAGLHHPASFGRTGSYRSSGFARSGTGFGRPGNEGGGFARTGSYNRSGNGFARSNGGGAMYGRGNAGGGFARGDGGSAMPGRNNAGGFARGDGGGGRGAFGNRNNGGGNGGFGNGGGGMLGNRNNGGGNGGFGNGGGGGMSGNRNGGGGGGSFAGRSNAGGNAGNANGNNGGGGGRRHH